MLVEMIQSKSVVETHGVRTIYKKGDTYNVSKKLATIFLNTGAAVAKKKARKQKDEVMDLVDLFNT